MNTRTILVATALMLGLNGAVVAQDGGHAHDHHEMHVGGELALTLPESGKWASDESLRQGMSELEVAFVKPGAAVAE